MKYSQQIGIIAAILIIAVCYLPWIEIKELNLVVNGVNGKINNNFSFGKPIILHSFCSIVSVILFSINKIWAKRVNIFFCFLNLSLALKNYILYKMCRPECPTVQFGLYLLLVLAITAQIMSFLPKMKIEN